MRLTDTDTGTTFGMDTPAALAFSERKEKLRAALLPTDAEEGEAKATGFTARDSEMNGER